jgi:heat-inducible transcriptional repressor
MQQPSQTLAELNDRARDIFREIVESYIATGVPVGSRTLSKLGAIGLSPASIRNVMQDLEELGLLASPHTSAGRVPTDLGLRLFVDGMMQAAEPAPGERAAIEETLRAGSVEDVLARATSVLSGLAACAGVVTVAKAEVVLRQLSFVPLSPERALAVLVGADGSVENRLVDLPPGVPPTALIEAANWINARFAGLSLSESARRLAAEIERDRAALDGAAADVVARGLAVWSADGQQRPVLIVRGSAHLLDDGSAADIERVRQLLDDLDGKEEMARMLDLARDAAAMKIFIGSENKLFSLSGSSVIAAPYRGGGDRVIGVVGVIGPVRLNYARVVPMVDYTAKALSRLIG